MVLVTSRWRERGQEEMAQLPEVLPLPGRCSYHLRKGKLLEAVAAGQAGLVQQLHFLGKE